MAQFKAGQRVRIIQTNTRSIREWGLVHKQEATIVSIGPGVWENTDCRIKPDGDARIWEAPFSSIEPLLPPDEKADEFIARLNKLGSEPVNDAPKVTERVAK